MIPAGKFTGAPGAGLGGVGVLRTLTMPAAVAPLAGGRLGALRGATAADGPLYAAVTVLGAGLGGALLGWVAADSREGATKAGAFAAGLTSVSTGMATWQGQKLLGGTMVVVGLGGMLWSIKDRIHRRRR